MATKFGREAVASHIPLLVRVFDLSEGDVLEIGTGYFSTLVLHWLATLKKRHVYSYESKQMWYDRAKKYANTYHHITHCESWDKADFENRHWGMVFIDHSPGRRRPTEVIRLANHADYVVAHDTQPDEDGTYGYSVADSHFKYKYNYTKIVPWTSVWSNFKDLKNIE